MKQARKWQAHYNVPCQLIAGASETNCKAVMYGGTMIKTSNYNGLMFEQLFEKLACGQVADACSVAKQMINDAHGRSREESLAHYVKQEMTYADSMDMQFVGRTLAEVLQQAMNKHVDDSRYDLNAVHHWIKTMKDFHGADTIKIAKRMIAKKEVRIVNDKVIASKFFYNAIDEWVKANGYKAIADDKKIEILDKYCELIGE